MCAISGVYDYFRQQVPTKDWTRPIFTEYQDILRRLDALDKKLNQPACEDPSKADYMREIEERLQRLGEEEHART